MKRSVQIALLVACLCGFVSSASAGPGSRFFGGSSFSGAGQSVLRQLGIPQLNTFKKKKHKPTDDTSQPPAPQNPPTPQGPPGYVWVGDHWERVRAPQQTKAPDNAGTPGKAQAGLVFVDGHWQRVKAANNSTNGPVIRDHRSPIVVTPTTGGPVIRDHRQPIDVTPTSESGPVIRDHRQATTNGTITVRDHRAKPQVRDHRQSADPYQGFFDLYPEKGP
jgi:hypothetical protein